MKKWKPVLSDARTIKRISDGHYLQVVEVKRDSSEENICMCETNKE